MANLNDLINTAKEQTAKRTAQNTEDKRSSVASPTAFTGTGDSDTPKAVNSIAQSPTDTVSAVPNENPLKNPADSAGEFMNEPTPKRKRADSLKNISEEELNELLTMYENRKKLRKKVSRQERKFTPEIMELKEKCRIFLDNNQIDEKAVIRVTGEARDLIFLFGKVFNIPTQVLASYIIQSYLEDNFAEFVKKVRRLGN